jgi:hypothetical protein
MSRRIIIEERCPEHDRMGCIFWGHNGKYRTVLDGPTDEMVERAAKGLQDLAVVEGWMLEESKSVQWPNSLKQAKAALSAALRTNPSTGFVLGLGGEE